MICGLGIDIVEVQRIVRILARYSHRFQNKILTQKEQEHMLRSNASLAYALAARFAAKEAAVKALGTGFSQGIGLHHIEILRLPTGQPSLELHGPAKEYAHALGVTHTHISLTHSKLTAAAVVVLEARS